ncbi:MAG: hypothetical protein QF682_12780 [Candidatus Thermoplasmatota archaeon]|jgi:hypothetical protein|nr:hypothetical protein [Candidatus Thermoplasmatota archaeon]
MAQTTLIKCSNCGKLIESLGEVEVICRFCGSKTSADEDKEETDFMRRAQIFNLEEDIKNEIFIRNISLLLASVTLVTGLFIVLAVNTSIVFMIVSLVMLLGWGGFGYFHHQNLDKLKSKKFDLAGGKLLSGY